MHMCMCMLVCNEFMCLECHAGVCDRFMLGMCVSVLVGTCIKCMYTCLCPLCIMISFCKIHYLRAVCVICVCHE